MFFLTSLIPFPFREETYFLIRIFRYCIKPFLDVPFFSKYLNLLVKPKQKDVKIKPFLSTFYLKIKFNCFLDFRRRKMPGRRWTASRSTTWSGCPWSPWTAARRRRAAERSQEFHSGWEDEKSSTIAMPRPTIFDSFSYVDFVSINPSQILPTF